MTFHYELESEGRISIRKCVPCRLEMAKIRPSITCLQKPPRQHLTRYQKTTTLVLAPRLLVGLSLWFLMQMVHIPSKVIMFRDLRSWNPSPTKVPDAGRGRSKTKKVIACDTKSIRAARLGRPHASMTFMLLLSGLALLQRTSCRTCSLNAQTVWRMMNARACSVELDQDSPQMLFRETHSAKIRKGEIHCESSETGEGDSGASA